MKKNRIGWVLCLLLCLFALPGAAQGKWAYRVDADGFAHVTAFDDSAASSASVPQEIDGYWVAGIDGEAFAKAQALRDLFVPATVARIAPDAFAGAKDVSIRAYNGSEALRYAEETGMDSRNLSDLYFTESVVDLTGIARADYSYVKNGIRLPKAYAQVLPVGALFFLPADERDSLGDAYQVRASKVDGDTVLITMAEAAPELVLTAVHLSLRDLKPDYSKAVVLDDGVEITARPSIGGVSRSIGIAYNKNGIRASGEIAFNLDYLNLDITMSPFEVKNFNYDVSIDGEITVGLTGEVEKEIELIHVPFYGAPGVAEIYATIGIEFEAEGGVTLTVDLGCEASAGYTPVTGWNSSFSGSGSVQPNAGVMLTTTLNLPKFAVSVPVLEDIAVVAAEIEAEVNVKSAYDVRYAESLTCLDADVKVTGKPDIWIGIDAEIGDYAIENKLSYSPFEVELFEDSYHIEQWNVMENCSYKGSWLYFDTDCEIVYPPQHCSYGYAIIPNIPTEMIRPNYEFLGWHNLPQGSPDAIRLQGVIEVPPEGMTVYAHWEEKHYEGEYAIGEMPQRESVNMIDCWQGAGEHPYYRYSIYESHAPYPSLADHIAFGGDPKDYRTDWLLESNVLYGSSVTNRSWAEGYIITNGDPYNKNLVSVSFPSTMQFSGNYTYCENLRYVDMSKMNVEEIYTSFENLGKLETVLLPKNLKRIGGFSGTKSLKSIDLPSTCTEIENSAFEGSGLTEFPVKEGVRKLGGSAFRDCDELTEVTIPASVNEIEHIGSLELCRIFWDCDNLETVTYADGSTIAVQGFKDCQKLKTVHLNQQQNIINSSAFENCLFLSEINFDALQMNVGSTAFMNCYSLKDVSGDFAYIGAGSFKNTVGLENVDLTGDTLVINVKAFQGSGVKRLNIRCKELVISGSAFMDCSRLTEVNIEADSVWMTGTENFSQCENLEKVTISAPGGGAVVGFENCEKLTSVSLSGSLSLDDQAFRNCPITELVLDMNYSDLNAFNNCALLEHVEITGSLNHVKQYAFENNYALEELTLPVGTGVIEGIKNCRKLRKVTIGEGYTEISGEAFMNCFPLEEITIPASVKLIGWNAFSGCTNLRTINILGSDTVIEDGAFINCPSLEEIICPAGSASEQFVHNGGASVGPAGVELLTLRITNNIGLETRDLRVRAGQRVTLTAPNTPSGFEFTGFFTDEYCLTPAANPFIMPDGDAEIHARYDRVYVPHDPSYSEGDNLLSWYNGEGFFSMHNIYAIGSGAIGPNVTSMRVAQWTWEAHEGAFVNATNLEEFFVEVGNEKFYAKDGVLYRYDGTLVACPAKTQIETLTIPDGITVIAADAFNWNGCESSLREIHIPDSVMTVGARAFDGIGAGTKVYGPESGPVAEAAWEAGLMYNRYQIAYVVDGEFYSMSACNAGALLPAVASPVSGSGRFVGWSTREGGRPVDLAAYEMPAHELVLYAVFDGGAELNWLSLPVSLTELEAEAFAGSAAQAIRCGAALRHIGARAFADCVDLRTVEIPAMDIEIAPDAFDGCRLDSLIVYAPAGSSAQIYAQQNGIAWAEYVTR